MPAEVLVNGRSKSKIACAIRHCCAGKAKKFYVVPKMVAMDGKILNKKVCRVVPKSSMVTKSSIPRMKSFALFAMFEKAENLL